MHRNTEDHKVVPEDSVPVVLPDVGASKGSRPLVRGQGPRLPGPTCRVVRGQDPRQMKFVWILGTQSLC